MEDGLQAAGHDIGCRQHHPSPGTHQQMAARGDDEPGDETSLKISEEFGSVGGLNVAFASGKPGDT